MNNYSNLDNSNFGQNETNITEKYIATPFRISKEDSNWIISNAFIIFTMQTGFGMLESGCVSLKNEVNIMMKNVVDISLGGLTYWIFGFGMSFGVDIPTNSFIGTSGYFLNSNVDDDLMGAINAAFVFQLSFATTATTIVSGAMAERCNFKAYCLFSFLNTVVYCIPAGWVWGDHGFLNHLGAVDIAGSGTVHLVGGISALACAIMLGPRLGRYDNGIESLPLGSPVNAILGLFVLWWGWLAFNSGSTYGITGDKWKYAARAAASTMFASMGGGIVGLGFSFYNKNGIDVLSQINGILGALVSITGGCFLYNSWEAIVIGSLGGFITCITMPIFNKLKIDDPVGASSTHGLAGMWGLLAIGIFADNPHPLNTTSGRSGVLKGGGWYLLGIQSLTLLCLTLWSFFSSLILLWIVNEIIPLRMSECEELIGADLVEHRIRHPKIGVSRAISALRPFTAQQILEATPTVGLNPGHDIYLTTYRNNKRLNKLISLMNKKKSFNNSPKNMKKLSKNSTKKDLKTSSIIAWID